MSIDITYSLPVRLKEARSFRAMTQDEVAKKAGISRKSLIRYESGESHPRPNVIENLSKALDISVEWLTSPLNADDRLIFDEIMAPDLAVNNRRKLRKINEQRYPYYGIEAYIPQPLYRKLKEIASRNRRHVMDEIIYRLEVSFDENGPSDIAEKLRNLASEIEGRNIFT